MTGKVYQADAVALRGVSVRSFGAVGGFADETAALQAAIDYAELINAELYFPPGAYLHTGLVSTKRIIWRGAGKWRSVLYLADTVSTTTDNITVVGNAAGGVDATGGGLYDLGILYAGAAAGRHGVHFDNNATGRVIFRFTISGCLVAGSPSVAAARAVCHTPDPAAAISAFSQVTFTDSEFGGGLKLDDVTDSIWVNRCYFSGLNVGIEANTVLGAAKWSIRDSTFVSSGGGLWFKARMISSTIADCYFEPSGALSGGSGNGALIDLDGGTTYDMYGNTIHGNQFSIIVGSGKAIRLDHCTGTHIGPNAYVLVDAASLGVSSTSTSSDTVLDVGNVLVSGSGALTSPLAPETIAASSDGTDFLDATRDRGDFVAMAAGAVLSLGGTTVGTIILYAPATGDGAVGFLHPNNGLVGSIYATNIGGADTGFTLGADSGNGFSVYNSGSATVVKNRAGVERTLRYRIVGLV